MAQQIFETVAAGVTNQVIGATGAAGDLLDFLLVVPTSLAPGAISVKDGSGTPIQVFAGGAGSISNLVPFAIPLALRAQSGPWQVSVGANMSVIAVGICN